MKKIYCVTLTDPDTNVITHCMTSDDVITDDMITADNTGISYIVEKFKFYNDENNMVRASEVMANMEKIGSNRVSLKTGANNKRFKNIAYSQ